MWPGIRAACRRRARVADFGSRPRAWRLGSLFTGTADSSGKVRVHGCCHDPGSPHAEAGQGRPHPLLELYSAWKRQPSAETEENLVRVVGEIRQINPSFKFELPRS